MMLGGGKSGDKFRCFLRHQVDLRGNMQNNVLSKHQVLQRGKGRINNMMFDKAFIYMEMLSMHETTHVKYC